jgi:hypothetical protein
MSILIALLYLALIILCVGLGYLVVMWALGIFGIVIPPRFIQIVFAIIIVLVLIWFITDLVGSGGVRLPSLRLRRGFTDPHNLCVCCNPM